MVLQRANWEPKAHNNCALIFISLCSFSSFWCLTGLLKCPHQFLPQQKSLTGHFVHYEWWGFVVVGFVLVFQCSLFVLRYYPTVRIWFGSIMGYARKRRVTLSWWSLCSVFLLYKSFTYVNSVFHRLCTQKNTKSLRINQFRMLFCLILSYP